jgi:hypothetical protein
MIRLVPAVAIVVLMSFAATALAAPGKIGPPARFITAVPADATTVANYYKQSVYDSSDNKIGDVVDLMVDKGGRLTTAMVGVGGFLGIDEKNVAIPIDTLTVSQKGTQRHLTLNTTKDALKSAAGFTYDRATVTWVSDKTVRSAGRKLPTFIGTMPRE